MGWRCGCKRGQPCPVGARNGATGTAKHKLLRPTLMAFSRGHPTTGRIASGWERPAREVAKSPMKEGLPPSVVRGFVMGALVGAVLWLLILWMLGFIG